MRDDPAVDGLGVARSAVLRAIARAPARDRALHDICRIAVHAAGFPLAWIGRREPSEGIEPIAHCAVESSMGVVRCAAQEPTQASCPAAIAMRAGEIQLRSGRRGDLGGCRCGAVAMQHGLVEAAAAPIRGRTGTHGVFMLYRAAPGAFQREDLEFMEDVCAAIAISMDCRADSGTDVEAAVRERTRELTAAKEVAQIADQRKSAFLNTLSHELRTPLTSVLGFTSLLLEQLPGPLNPEQTRQLKMILASGRQLLAFVNDIMDLHRIESGQLRIFLQPFDLDQAIQKVLSMVQPLADAKGLRLGCELQDSPRWLVSDQRRIEQLLMKLLTNAIQFTERGYVKLAVAVPGGDPGPMNSARREVHLRVIDSGIGIADGELPGLFTAYGQAGRGERRSNEGNRLGLAICHALAGLLRGSIHVESQPGKGSTFTVRLPLHSQSPTP